MALVRAAAKKEKMMWETLREAIDEEMEADPTVLVMGERPAMRTCMPLPPRFATADVCLLSAAMARELISPHGLRLLRRCAMLVSACVLCTQCPWKLISAGLFCR